MVSVDPLTIGITGRSKDQGADATNFGHHLLKLRNRHEMIIYSGLAKWRGSEELTCFPHGGGINTVDYLIGTVKAIHMINSFLVPPYLIGACHRFLYFELVKNRGRFYAVKEMICACVYVCERERVETQDVY